MKTYAIIPARSGSKGIPNKNIVNLLGRPLIAYTIHHALNTPEISKVFVSTDDQRIASVAVDCGADVIKRPRDISGDSSPVEDTIKHFLFTLEQDQDELDILVFLQTTSPIRKKDDISLAIDTFISEAADSLFSSRKIEGFIWGKRGLSYKPIGYKPNKRPMRQELSAINEEENGSIYIFKPWILKKYNARIGGKVASYHMDLFSSIQIDEPEDIEIAEKVLTVFDKYSVPGEY